MEIDENRTNAFERDREGGSESGDVTTTPGSGLVSFVGNFDGLWGLEAKGWLYDPRNPNARLTIEVLIGDTAIARGVADELRPDLLKQGIGDGRHAFRISLPDSLCDGVEHFVHIREATSGQVLPSSPRRLLIERAVSGYVDGLNGSGIIGWARHDALPNRHLKLAVREQGKVLGHAVADQERAGVGAHGFWFPLPDEVLDGRLHVFSVDVVDPPSTLGEVAVITPFVLTPESHLKRASKHRHRAYLSPSAGFRYESLRRQLKHLAAAVDDDDDSIAGKLRELLDEHDYLVSGMENFRSDVVSPAAIAGAPNGAARRPETPTDLGQRLPEITLPSPTDPLVSIVIPVHNKVAMSFHCLASLNLAPNEASFEVIVVDDGSSDETLYLDQVCKGLRIIRNETAQGFVRACNRGAAAARGEYIVLLNNDTEVTAGWLDALLDPFRRFDRVGLTGSKLIYPTGQLQEAGGIVWGTGDPWNYGRNGNPQDPRYNYVRQVDYLSGASIMLPKALWDRLGGFDLDFAPAYYEDTDLAFRVRAAGYRTVYTPFSQVIHFEGVSSGTSTSSGMKRFQEINKPKFRRRWASAFEGNGIPGKKNVETVKDRGVRHRALVIDHQTPEPDVDAGSYAAMQEMRLLQSLGFKVTFMPRNLAYSGRYTEELQRNGIETVYAPFYLSMRDFLEKRGSEFDLFYITRYYVAESCVDDIRRYAPHGKILLCNADLHFLRELRAALLSKDQAQLESAIKTRDDELAVMRKVDLVLSYNDTEHSVIISHNLTSSRVARCPWVAESVREVPGFKERAHVAFLGGFRHPPNAEAVEYFVTDVMPLLRQRLPGVEFRVYGSHVPDSIKTLAGDGVVIEGYVDDVADVYDSCRVFTAPLLHGAGIKGKVAAALARGVPCVLSPVAVEGMSVRDGVEVRVARRPEEWADAIAELYEDQQRWEAMQRAAWAFAESQFSFETAHQTMREALEAAGVFVGDSIECLAFRPT